MKCSLGVSNYLEEISHISSSIVSLFLCIDHWGRLSYLSLLFFWNSAFKWIYLSFSPLPFPSVLFTAICKASSDNHFAFLHFFFLGMVLLSASCTMLWNSIHSSSDTLSDLIPWVYLSLSLYNHKQFDLSHTWWPSDFPCFFNLSLNFVIRSSWYETQSAPNVVLADCIELLHQRLQRI